MVHEPNWDVVQFKDWIKHRAYRINNRDDLLLQDVAMPCSFWQTGNHLAIIFGFKIPLSNPKLLLDQR